jgi:DNA-binding NarL/FixJ family response regulator
MKGENKLTETEQKVFKLIVTKGFSDRELSEKTGKSLRAIKFHVQSVLHKLSAGTRSKLIVKYWRSAAS